jgi:hypothetical protein
MVWVSWVTCSRSDWTWLRVGLDAYGGGAVVATFGGAVVATFGGAFVATFGAFASVAALMTAGGVGWGGVGCVCSSCVDGICEVLRPSIMSRNVGTGCSSSSKKSIKPACRRARYTHHLVHAGLRTLHEA